MRLMCKNMTHAMKANKVLYNNGIHSKVEKINNNPDIKGCVYCICFEDKYKETVIDIFKKYGVILHKSEHIKFGD